MLDLQARIHLQKINVQVAAGDELHRACVAIADRSRGLDRKARQLIAQGGRQNRARRLFDDFLPPPLRAAIALEQMHDIAMRVAEHLHFEMARMLNQPLQHQPVVAERSLGLAPRRRKLSLKRARFGNRADSAPAAAANGLDEKRVA